MANTTAKNTTKSTTKTGTTRTRKTKSSAEPTKSTAEDIVIPAPVEPKKPKREKSKLGIQIRNVEQIPLDALITVRNMTAGMLVYTGRHLQGYTISWDRFGETREMEMRELYNMKNTDSMFFKNNWVEVDQLVMENLHVDQYYKNAITYDEIEDIPYGSIDSIRDKFASASEQTKAAVVMRVAEFIAEGQITDIRTIQELETITGCKLIDKE